MAQYLVLIYGDEQQWSAMSPEQWAAHGAAHGAFHAAAGPKVLGGGALQGTAVATTLRTRPGRSMTTTDGPFLETKEAVGGFYLVEATDLDEVLALTALLPEAHAGHSGLEIRPMVERG